jgi:hypothetical protein
LVNLNALPNITISMSQGGGPPITKHLYYIQQCHAFDSVFATFWMVAVD